ncbi:MAG TPA: hypothetical protein VF170_10995 [Planctomycetaceae bacterium]
MRTLRIPLRVVFYPEDGEWIAHCLEFDLLGSGSTKQEAVESLAEAIRLQVDESLRHDNPRNLFSPADGEYFEMFAAGREIAAGELHIEPAALSKAPVLIERAEVREYAREPVGAV